jgi:hypothetical protein
MMMPQTLTGFMISLFEIAACSSQGTLARSRRRSALEMPYQTLSMSIQISGIQCRQE